MDTYHNEKARMLNAGSTILSVWTGIDYLAKGERK